MPKNENRLNRINEELRKEISQIISYELKNPEATGLISVTKVKITPDLKYAKVYISMINTKNDEKTLEAIKKSSGFIRSEIAKRINLRITPELVFEIDDSLEYGAKIDKIIDDLKKEK
ncbi:MAG: 30S ribosome-binding factor RbfA [Clostridiaceae bacterium]|nr:30S ribosome-binding factor RbfA [Clostridiaceae bacterium]